MSRPSWDESRDLWQVDGSLRDLYVEDATPDDWHRLLDLAVRYGTEYRFEGMARPLPSVDDIFSHREGSHLLVVRVGSVVLNCHFFDPSEIELDIDPRDVRRSIEHEMVLGFVERLASDTGKRVHITPENARATPLLTYASADAWSREDPRVTRLECHTSKVKVLALLGLTIVMAFVSWFCTTIDRPIARVFGWIGVAFFGLGFVAFPVMLFRGGPQVVVDDAGIEDRRSRVGVIPWASIRALSIRSIRSTGFLCVETTDPARYMSHLPRWKRWLARANQALGFPGLTIGFSGLSPGLDAVWKLLEAVRRVEAGADGLRVFAAGASPFFACRWHDIERVEAFKRDLVTVDQICLHIRARDSEVYLDEEMRGWEELVEQMPRQLAGCPTYSDWWREVAFPAFEANPRVLFERAAR